MVRDELDFLYFNWLYNMVCGDEDYNRLSYRKLLTFLYNTEFTYLLDRDENRAIDGINFRYRFGYENGYSREAIKQYLDNRPCNVLEMMIALAFKAEEQIMDDNRLGNRTGQWFWNMIVSLGLFGMSDLNFMEFRAQVIIERFLERNYAPDGQGGLFTISNPRRDMRDVEIWAQFMWYLDETIENY